MHAQHESYTGMFVGQVLQQSTCCEVVVHTTKKTHVVKNTAFRSRYKRGDRNTQHQKPLFPASPILLLELFPFFSLSYSMRKQGNFFRSFLDFPAS